MGDLRHGAESALELLAGPARAGPELGLAAAEEGGFVSGQERAVMRTVSFFSVWILVCILGVT